MDDSDIDLHIGTRLRRRRRAMGLTQTQLGASVGVRFQQVQKYECGANKLSAAKLWRCAQALGVPLSYFFDNMSDLKPLPRMSKAVAFLEDHDS